MSEFSTHTVIPDSLEAIASFGSGNGTRSALARGTGRSGTKKASAGAFKSLRGRVSRSGNKKLAAQIAAGGLGGRKMTNKQLSAFQAQHAAFRAKAAARSVASAKRAAGGPGAYARAAARRGR